MTGGRRALGALGVLVAAYGAWLLVSREAAHRLVEVGLWLGAGVLLHDVVLAPLVLLGTALAARVLPAAWRSPAVVVLVVLGAVTLLAVPVLGRFGARADNTTLLDRDYTTGWLLVAGLVVLGAALGAVLGPVLRAARRRRTPPPVVPLLEGGEGDGARPGR